ncbi:hypothetical protein PCANC_25239 [Puccinia coronata f. sp. avenae]|uniref:Uncharacterized protein n=1 Tax=Puccinia coronata f. sp. avenae TaxID=200324 RepID=A0A2N5TPD7_9BASI|nr:hypothetical protein PCANC_25239 [Puccinia coronata f. sp. avenae]
MHRCHFHPTDAEKSITTTYLLLVPLEQLGGMGEMFKQALADEAALLDMERGALKMCNTMEVDTPDCLTSAGISNFLYGSGSNLVTGRLAQAQALQNPGCVYSRRAGGGVQKVSRFPPS